MSCEPRGLWKLPRLTVLWKTCRFAWKAGLEDSATFPQVSHRTLEIAPKTPRFPQPLGKRSAASAFTTAPTAPATGGIDTVSNTLGRL